jgi:hypothetical protein
LTVIISNKFLMRSAVLNQEKWTGMKHHVTSKKFHGKKFISFNYPVLSLLVKPKKTSVNKSLDSLSLYW